MEKQVEDLHQKFQMYGKNAREWMRRCALLLPEIVRERVWEKKGFGSIYEYAGKLAGMSRSAVEEALWVIGRIENKPELLSIVAERGVGAVRPVASIATVDTAAFWAEKVMEMSKHTLQAYVHEVKRDDENLPPGRQIQQETMEIIMQLPCEMGEALMKLKGNNDWSELISEFLDLRMNRLEQEKPEEQVAHSRHIPVAIEGYVLERARGVCEFRACKKQYEILHHIQRFALERVHDPSRIVALCRPHERMVHLGLIEDETILPSRWKVMEEADKKHPKYQIDQMVQKYRRHSQSEIPMINTGSQNPG